MMTTNQIKANYNGLLRKYGPTVAQEMFVEKYPDSEGDLELFLTGQLEIPEDLKYTAPEDELPEVEDEADIIAETKVEVKAEEPKAEKPKKAKEIKEKAPKADKAPSKAELARKLYAEAEDKSRKVITQRFVTELGLTTAGANTYYNNIKKATAA